MNGPRPASPNKWSSRRRPVSTVRMAGEEYQRILVQRLHAQVRWENQPADDWTVADLDHGQIILTVEEAIRRGRMEDPGTRSPFELLRGLNLLLHDGSLTRAAVVLFGSSVRLEAEFTQMHVTRCEVSRCDTDRVSGQPTVSRPRFRASSSRQQVSEGESPRRGTRPTGRFRASGRADVSS